MLLLIDKIHVGGGGGVFCGGRSVLNWGVFPYEGKRQGLSDANIEPEKDQIRWEKEIIGK